MTRDGSRRGRRTRVRPLLPRDLPDLETCAGCPSTDPADEHVRAAVSAWGWCGLAVVDGDRMGAHVLATPVTTSEGVLARITRLHPVTATDGSAAPATRDADAARHPIEVRVHAQQLVETLAARSLRRGVVAVEAHAHRWAGHCGMPPMVWLAARGFVVTQTGALHPWMRLDLNRTVSEQSGLREAWSRLTDLVRTPPPPEPIGRLTHRTGG
ncbi:hypothetical protein [Desertihabitans aurantiacus]|uniref:hypothetical protein n=1 Tax=Desertihabitans aurantiacus TaxID=2282477 RepID=UPI000DF75474|nr:hypothetical protein [Desertihabitans aurantiacus]